MAIDIDIDVTEVVACARYGELPELQEELARLRDAHPETAEPAILALVPPHGHGNTALHMAAANDHKDIVSFLLERLYAPHVNAQNELGNTPLHWCALNGHAGVAELLIKAGADLTLSNAAGKTALYEAQMANHEEVALLILKHINLDDGEAGDCAVSVAETESCSANPAAGPSAAASLV